jgi:galactokinase
MDNLEAVREQMDELVFARALHVISENARTLAAVEALERGDFHSVGEKMTSSHESLRDCYEVSVLIHDTELIVLNV